MSQEIHKKTWSSVFEKVLDGSKTFDVRLADWECNTDDVLVLDEVDDMTKQPTGRSLRKTVGFILRTKDMPFFSEDEAKQHGLQVISLLEEK